MFSRAGPLRLSVGQGSSSLCVPSTGDGADLWHVGVRVSSEEICKMLSQTEPAKATELLLHSDSCEKYLWAV